MHAGRAVFLDDETSTGTLFDVTFGFWSLVEFSLFLVLFESHASIISYVGRLKIKKKETVLPFRQTMAYRMLLLTLSLLFFIYTVYEMSVSLMANNTVAFIISVLVGLFAAFAVFH